MTVRLPCAREGTGSFRAREHLRVEERAALSEVVGVRETAAHGLVELGLGSSPSSPGSL